jgi:hypothetical protein
MSMAGAISICLSGGPAWIAEELAVDVGERRYFELKLRPVMRERAALRQAGLEPDNLTIAGLISLTYPPSAF